MQVPIATPTIAQVMALFFQSWSSRGLLLSIQVRRVLPNAIPLRPRNALPDDSQAAALLKLQGDAAVVKTNNVSPSR